MGFFDRQTLSVSWSFVDFLGSVSSGCALLCASRTAGTDLDAKQCSRMSTNFAREYTVFAPAQLLCNWREQRPSNQGDHWLECHRGESVTCWWTCFWFIICAVVRDYVVLCCVWMLVPVMRQVLWPVLIGNYMFLGRRICPSSSSRQRQRNRSWKPLNQMCPTVSPIVYVDKSLSNNHEQ
jgi:hypothetical protein